MDSLVGFNDVDLDVGSRVGLTLLNLNDGADVRVGVRVGSFVLLTALLNGMDGRTEGAIDVAELIGAWEMRLVGTTEETLVGCL